MSLVSKQIECAVWHRRAQRIRPALRRGGSIGHGERVEVTRDETRRRASEANPTAAASSSDTMIGKEVKVGANDYRRDLISGTLVGATEHELSVLRNEMDLTEI